MWDVAGIIFIPFFPQYTLRLSVGDRQVLYELHSFSKYLLSALDMPGTVLGPGCIPALMDFIFQCEISDDISIL